MLEIKGQKREPKAPVNEKKELKAVVYGPHMENNLTITVSPTEFKRVFKEAGTSQIISLSIDGEEHEVMIKDFQLNPVSDDFVHVDFYAITRGEEMEVAVPFEFKGEAPALESGNNILNKVLSEIKVKCLPRNIPSEIEIDLGALEKAGDSIRLADIKLPEGVEFLTDNFDEVIVSVSENKEEVEENTEAQKEEGGSEEESEE